MSYSPISKTWYVDGPADALKHMCDRADVKYDFSSSPSLADPAAIYSSTVFLKNTGSRLVRVTSGNEIHFLEPKETVCIGLGPDLKIPEVVALNNGV